jgi:NAD(P)-dependent dehydrogenase (short-subunit alcohol dehydrogenase family)
MLELEGKVAFITGGASGIGLGQAKVLAEEAGMKVAIADVQRNRLDEAIDYFRTRQVRVYPVILDVTDRAAYAQVATEVESVLGPVQLLVNTAGVSHRGPLESATYADWDWHIDINLNGVINGIQTFLPRMIRYGRGGHIVNTASISSFFAFPTATLYTTTKFALRGLSEGLRVDLEKYNIGVSCLCPGAVNTNIMEAAGLRDSRYGDTGFTNPDQAEIARVKDLLKEGFDPVDLARIMLESVRRNDFWIFPHPEYIERIEAQTAELIQAINAWRNHPEYVRREKLREQQSNSASVR